MPLTKSQQGGTMLYVIAAIIVVSALAAGISRLSSTAGLGVVTAGQSHAAYYAALSGIEYAKTLDSAALETIRAGTGAVYTMPGGAKFTLTAQAPISGVYPVRSIGTVNDGTGLEANSLAAASVTPKTSEWAGGDYVINTNGPLALPQSAVVNGSVAGKNLLLNQYAAVTGNVISSTSADLGQYATVGGYVCAASGNVALNQYAEVAGDVSANGNITVGQYAKAKANAYATGRIDMNQSASIAKTGQAGGAINRAQYDFIGTPLPYTMPTVTCPATAAPVAPAITSASTVNVPASNASKPIPAGTAYKAWSTNQHGSAYMASGTYVFASIQYSQYMDLYLDVSSGQPLTILSAGFINTGQYTYVHIKTADTGGSYLSMEQIEALPAPTKAKVRAAAKLIYMGAETSMQWSQYGTWLGTLYAGQNLSISQYFTIIGALASPGSMNLSSNLTILEYILADYAKQNWK